MPADAGGATRPDDPLAGLPDLAALATYDAELRQVPADAVAMQAAMDAAAARLAQIEAAGPSPAAVTLPRYLGNGLRILGRHAEAVRHLERAVALAATLDLPKAEAASLIRLGEAHRNAGTYAEAERSLRDPLAKIRANRDELGVYEDFALQHLGKCLTDAG